MKSTLQCGTTFYLKLGELLWVPHRAQVSILTCVTCIHTHTHPPTHQIASFHFFFSSGLVSSQSSEALQINRQSRCLWFRIQIVFQSNRSITVMSCTKPAISIYLLNWVLHRYYAPHVLIFMWSCNYMTFNSSYLLDLWRNATIFAVYGVYCPRVTDSMRAWIGSLCNSPRPSIHFQLPWVLPNPTGWPDCRSRQVTFIFCSVSTYRLVSKRGEVVKQQQKLWK